MCLSCDQRRKVCSGNNPMQNHFFANFIDPVQLEQFNTSTVDIRKVSAFMGTSNCTCREKRLIATGSEQLSLI